jgi:hypothetical protein
LKCVHLYVSSHTTLDCPRPLHPFFIRSLNGPQASLVT